MGGLMTTTKDRQSPHDDSHATADKKTITQDCSACHQALAVEETSPEILKTLGVSERIASLQKQ